MQYKTLKIKIWDFGHFAWEKEVQLNYGGSIGNDVDACM